MKILSCYIENYGKIQNRTIDFSSELHIIKEDNGWGKTTLASFIKSMFYGVPDNRGNDISGNERKKYMPWNGAKFGGNITFEINGTQYRLERFFGKKPNEDSFAIYNALTNKLTQNFKENIGEQLFGINKEAYERSTYIPQNSIVLDGLNSDIDARLINLINDTDGKHSFDSAEKRLRDAEKDIAPKRKEGKLDFVNKSINNIKIKIADCETYESSLNDKRTELEQLGEKLLENTTKLKGIENKIHLKNTENEKSANASHYKELKTALAKAIDEKKSLEYFFNGQDYTKIDTIKISKLIENANGLEKTIHSLKLSIGEFKSQQIQVAANRKSIETDLTAEKNTKENLENKNTLLLEKKEVLLSRRASPQVTPVSLSAPPATLKVSNKLMLILAIAALIVIGGIGSCFFVLGLGIALIVFGLIGLIVCGMLWFKKYIDIKAGAVPSPQTNQAPQDTAILQLDISTIETEISNNIIKISDSDNKIIQIKNSLKAVTVFDSSTLSATEFEQESSMQEFGSITTIINDEFSKYRFSNKEWASCLALLNSNINKAGEITQSVVEIERKINEFTKDKNDIDYILGETIYETIDRLISQKTELENGITTINKTINKTQDTIITYENVISEKDTLVSELDLQIESRAKLENKLSIIQKTVEYLTNAKDLLASQYLQPLMQNSQNYISLFNDQPIKFKFDSDTKILIEENGQNHSLDFYSTGYKEFISICTRFALVDTIFTKEKPPIILDDPFVNLDDTKLTQAKTLIEKLSKKHQIIYFTCHNSRQI